MHNWGPTPVLSSTIPEYRYSSEEAGSVLVVTGRRPVVPAVPGAVVATGAAEVPPVPEPPRNSRGNPTARATTRAGAAISQAVCLPGRRRRFEAQGRGLETGLDAGPRAAPGVGVGPAPAPVGFGVQRFEPAVIVLHLTPPRRPSR